jgi:hypothetical protein
MFISILVFFQIWTFMDIAPPSLILHSSLIYNSLPAKPKFSFNMEISSAIPLQNQKVVLE